MDRAGYKTWEDYVHDTVADAIARVDADPTWEPPVGDPAKMFRVKIVAHSVGHSSEPENRRAPPLVSYRITAPRIILAEINTHRVLTKSSESSRAIPPGTRVGQVIGVPYRVMRFGRRKAGMVAGDDLSPAEMRRAAACWEVARAAVLGAAGKLLATGLAKEEFNRLLEPWALCRTILTGTEWANYFALRTHDTASPAFRYLARAMYVASRRSEAKELRFGEWHAPFTDMTDVTQAMSYCTHDPLNHGGVGYKKIGAFGVEVDPWQYATLRWSAARCARISFGLPGTPDKPPSFKDDDSTWANLTGFDRADPVQVAAAASANPSEVGPGDVWPYDPLHASPMEHQGTPLHPAQLACNPRLASNLFGWLQFRRLLGGETARRFAPPEDVVRGWEEDVHPDVFSGRDLY